MTGRGWVRDRGWVRGSGSGVVGTTGNDVTAFGQAKGGGFRPTGKRVDEVQAVDPGMRWGDGRILRLTRLNQRGAEGRTLVGRLAGYQWRLGAVGGQGARGGSGLTLRAVVWRDGGPGR